MQLAVLKEIRREAVGIVPAESAEDHIDLRIAERRKQIRRAVLRMVLYILDTGERVWHEPDIKSIVRKALHADIQLMLYEALPQHAGGKAHDRNGFYHKNTPLLFSGIIPLAVCSGKRKTGGGTIPPPVCSAYAFVCEIRSSCRHPMRPR